MIKSIIFHFKKNKELIKDNLILFSAISFANLLNYVFHFYAGRTLGPSDYGVFGVLLSIIYLIVLPLMAIQTTLSKFVAELNAKNEINKISYLFHKSIKKIGLIGIVISIFFLAISPILSSFLRIGIISPLIILGISIVFAFLVPVLRGFLQGLQKFNLLGVTFIVESLTKIFLGIPLIFLGFGVNGAVGAFSLGFLFQLIGVFHFIRKLFAGAKEKFITSDIYKYSLPVLIMLISLTAFYSLDVILVKRLFDPITAGHYAALSLFGKIIFFASISISMVMFPKISELKANNRGHKSLLLKSLMIALLLGLIASLFYFLMPKFIIGLLFGKEYLVISELLGIFGIVMTIYSLSYIIAYYNIALNRIKFLYLLIFFNLLEIVLILLFHSSLFVIVMILLIIILLLFLSLIVYTLVYKETYNKSNY